MNQANDNNCDRLKGENGRRHLFESTLFGCDPKDGQTGTFRSIEVKSLKKMTEIIQQCGGQMIGPRVEIPDIGVLAYCLDSDGNLLGILERNSS